MTTHQFPMTEPGADGEGNMAPPTTTYVMNEKALQDGNSSNGYPDEKKEPYLSEAYPTDSQEEHEQSFANDPFRPFDNLPEERSNILTVRAIIIGLIAGTLVNASNVYLGLKSGWTFTANLFGAIVGFGVIKLLSTSLPHTFPILGGSFGPRENNIVQTVATAAGGMSNVFVSAYPALYQLNLMGANPKADYWRIVALTAVGGYFGFFFATPLRKFFIIYVARELRLIFPTASATAMTIRSMHDAASGALIGKKKMRALGIAFIGALILRVVSVYAPGILWEWHFFTWFFIWSGFKNQALAVENWGWFIQFTPAFIGSGMLVGLNVSLSFLGGSILSWGIIGPLLVHYNAAFGKTLYPKDPHWKGLVSFASFGPKYVTKETPSPRYWLLWPGVLAMIAISFTELFLQWQIIAFAFKAVIRGTARGIHDISRKSGREITWLRNRVPQQDETQQAEESALPHELVKTWMWAPGLLLVVILMCVVMGTLYDMPVGMSLLSVFLAFFFSFLAIQCTGVTDITPLTAASKASQIVLGGATKGEHWQVAKAEKLNLLGGALANIGANQSTDLVADFRVGFLLRTPPNQQWAGQAIGTVAAVFLAPLMFILFGQAYPCILDSSIETCPFSYPSVAAWKAVAVAMVDPKFPVPRSSGIFAICFAIFGTFMTLVRHFAWRGKLEWVKAYHPNMMCVALAMVVPQTYYGTAMVIGSAIATIWAKKNPKTFEIFAYAIAAGLIAGEGIGGTVLAILEVAGVSGSKYGSTVACPNECS